MLLEQVRAGTPYYYHADRHGSVRALSDANGDRQATYQDDAYGATTASTGSLYNPFRYAGGYRDNESGLYYLQARYYDPSTQQFLSVDPLLAVTGQAYDYVAGSPTNGIDPTGAEASPFDHPEPPRPSFLCNSLSFLCSDEERPAKERYDQWVAYERALHPMVIAEIQITDIPWLGGEGPLVAGEAGRFGDLDARRLPGDDLTPHHMPQARQGFTCRNDGGALMLPTAAHKLTRTFAANGRMVYAKEAGTPFRQGLARDMFDIISNFGPQYNPGLRQLLQYYRDNFPELINK